MPRLRETWPLVRAERPDARLVVVCGPRIDPATIAAGPGLEARPYLHDLHEHLACCDLGIVQGGLSTTMELALARRPFIYFPLRDHCEQELHVAHRLDRHGAGRRMDYATDEPGGTWPRRRWPRWGPAPARSASPSRGPPAGRRA